MLQTIKRFTQWLSRSTGATVKQPRKHRRGEPDLLSVTQRDVRKLLARQTDLEAQRDRLVEQLDHLDERLDEQHERLVRQERKNKELDLTVSNHHGRLNELEQTELRRRENSEQEKQTNG